MEEGVNETLAPSFFVGIVTRTIFGLVEGRKTALYWEQMWISIASQAPKEPCWMFSLFVYQRPNTLN